MIIRSRPEGRKRQTTPRDRASHLSLHGRVLPSVTVKVITVNYEPDAAAFAERLFGYRPADDELACLAGLLDGATVTVSVKRQKSWLYLSVNDPRFERYETSVRKDVDGGLFAYIHHTYVAAGQTGQGYGLRAFLQQVRSAQRLGLTRFELYAAGNPATGAENGYYTWARYGFNAALREPEIALLPAALRGVADLNEVMQRGYHWWWKATGDSRSMVFDLAQNSSMMQVFRAYLETKKLTFEE